MRYGRLILLLLLACCVTWAPAQVVRVYALSLDSTPLYGRTMTHFAYTNAHAPQGGSLRLSAFGTFDSLNPFLDKGTPAEGLGQVFETLGQRSEDEPFSVYPLVAAAFEYDPQDRSWIIFDIDPRARFANGEKIQAADIAYSFPAIMTQGDPGYRVMLAGVRDVQVLSAQRIRFDFRSRQDRSLPLLLASQLPVLSADYYRHHVFAHTTLTPPLGSGPYQIERIDPGHAIVYRRNRNYWGAQLPVNVGCYNIDRITYIYYRDAVVAEEAFKAGQYDLRLENKAKNWAKLYNFPAARQGWVRKEALRNGNPAGMQGFVFNIRRHRFQDRRVREAIAQAFDFEWSNRFLFYGAYRRDDSYFANSELACPPGPLQHDVAMLLAPYRAQLPASVFTGVRIPVSDGHGSDRNNLIYAQSLLKQAGYRVVNDQLIDAQGRSMRFEILNAQPEMNRIIEPFMRNLEKLGIHATLRNVDVSQYINRMRRFDFDMTISSFAQTLSPGGEQRNTWSSAAATHPGSQNIIGIHDPVVDHLIDLILQAKDRHQLITASQALDRVLMAHWYLIPQYYVDSYRVAYWNFLRHPAILPRYAFDLSIWWVDAAAWPAVRAHQDAGD